MKLNKAQAIARRNQELGGAVLGVNNCHFTDLDRKRNIWWFDLPMGRIAVGQYEWIHLLMHNAETDQLLHLKVPTAFLREHIEGLVVRNAGKRKPEITLELSADKDSFLKDVRPAGAGVGFAPVRPVKTGSKTVEAGLPAPTLDCVPIQPGKSTGMVKNPAFAGFLNALLLETEFLQLFITQFATQDLAHVGRRQGIAELHGLRHLVAGDVGAHMLHHLVLGQGGARLDHDEDLDVLPGLLVRHADGRALQHARQGLPARLPARWGRR